jgi:hypothetical protein
MEFSLLVVTADLGTNGVSMSRETVRANLPKRKPKTGDESNLTAAN